jgi:hypothetical protein
MVLFLNLSAHAGGWDQCKGCHDGVLAPDEQALKKRYKTANDLINAAKKSVDPLMVRYRENEENLRKAANGIGLK